MRVAAVARVFTGGSVGPPRVVTAGGALAVGGLALALCIVALSFAHLGFTRVCVLLLLTPLVEEAVFRAGLQEALLLRWNAPRLANLATALVFGLAHVVARGDPGAFVVVLPALLLGAVYGRWRRLRWCVALHAAMNGVWLAAALAGPASVIGF
jgi:hypothetical protein